MEKGLWGLGLVEVGLVIPEMGMEIVVGSCRSWSFPQGLLFVGGCLRKLNRQDREERPPRALRKALGGNGLPLAIDRRGAAASAC